MIICMVNKVNNSLKKKMIFNCGLDNIISLLDKIEYFWQMPVLVVFRNW